MLITGASQGLWRQFARGLSAQGAAVVLAARQTGQRVRVNALAPGYIDAEMNHEFWDKANSAAPCRRRIRSRRRDYAAGVGRVTLHDRQRRDGGWRVFVELRQSVHVIASQRVARMRAR